MKTPSQNFYVPLSPRRRRVRVTVAILAVLMTVGIVAGSVWYLNTRPVQYRPGEESADLTRELERNLPADAPRPRFTDVTAEAGLKNFKTFIGPRSSQLPEDNGSGLAWGDFDNDGDDDVFLVSAGGALHADPSRIAPSELYENLGKGTFRKVEAFPSTRIYGMAAVWGDYDEDGFLDLAVAGYNTLVLYRNEQGTGKFSADPRFPNRPGYWSGLAWGDYNNDRHLDLYVCGYVQYTENESDRGRVSTQIGNAVPYTLNPASYTPGTNLLLKSQGDGTFSEVAATLGVTNPAGRSLGAVWHDFDDDGWQDLYVANDISDNVFYYNLGGTFKDISHPAHVADYRSAMGLAVGDFDRDGDDDMFVGHWVAQENALYQNLLVEKRGGSSKTTNAPIVPLQFLDIADMKGVGQIALPYVSWGAEFVDLDADGWLDLLVANGNTIEEDGPAPKQLKPQDSFLFWNRRGDYFYNLAPLCPPLAQKHVSRGLAASDYDDDGDMDILISHLGEGVQLLRNDMQTGRWLKLRLHSKLSDGSPHGFGDGARVTAWVGNVPLRRAVTGVSYLSQSSRTLHFGLGDATRVERLEVHWLGGSTQNFANLDCDTTWEITEGQPVPKRWSGPTQGPDVVKAPAAPQNAAPKDERAQLLEFWNRQRDAMNALKVEKNIPKAITLFTSALALNPQHEDCRYYLAHCLAAENRFEEALVQLEELKRINPQSHRAFQQWGILRARTAQGVTDMLAAEQSLERAHAINPEETGALLVLGEIALLRKDTTQAEQRFQQVCRTNPKAIGALFLQAYVAWKRGNAPQAMSLLAETRKALGPEWKPAGSTSEGDVSRKQHVELTPLSRFWETWDGRETPEAAFLELDKRLQSVSEATTS